MLQSRAEAGGTEALAPCTAAVPSAAQPSAPGPSQYSVGDMLLVEQYGQWYEAKVIEVRTEVEGDDALYRRYWKVHYMQWHKRWDMWVGAAETRRCTAEAKRETDRLNAQLKDSRNRSRSSSSTSSSKPASGSIAAKRSRNAQRADDAAGQSHRARTQRRTADLRRRR